MFIPQIKALIHVLAIRRRGIANFRSHKKSPKFLMNPNPNPKSLTSEAAVSWFAEQAPPKDPPTEPRVTQSHAAPAGGPAVAHQESSGHEEAPAGACYACDRASGVGLRAAPGGDQARAEHVAISRRPHTERRIWDAPARGPRRRLAERPRRSSLLRASGGGQHRPRVWRALLRARAAAAGARALLPAKAPSA